MTGCMQEGIIKGKLMKILNVKFQKLPLTKLKKHLEKRMFKNLKAKLLKICKKIFSLL